MRRRYLVDLRRMAGPIAVVTVPDGVTRGLHLLLDD